MIVNGVTVKKDERIDDLHRNGYLLIQNAKYFCFGIDAVLLSSFAKIKKNEKVIDLGTGNGIIPILLSARYPSSYIIGLEIQETSVEMAIRSVRLNSLQDRIRIQKGNIKHLTKIFKPASFQVITVNPPYMNQGGGVLNVDDSKAIARHEICCNLKDIIEESSKALSFGGRFYMVHRPHRLVDILYTLRNYNIEPKTIRFVHPYVNKEPNMVLIEAIKYGKPMCKIMPPIIVYNEDGEYTDEINKIYYD